MILYSFSLFYSVYSFFDFCCAAAQLTFIGNDDANERDVKEGGNVTFSSSFALTLAVSLP